MRWFLLLLWLLPVCVHAADTKGTGLPVPRFASLKSGEVNARTGPGTRYPIAWVYKRENLPVEIVEEYDHWRKIKDSEGTAGWVHKTMLEGKRFAMIRGKSPVIVKSDPESDAGGVLRLAPKVIVRLVACKKAWCKIQVQGQKGWLLKKQVWGVYEGEELK